MGLIFPDLQKNGFHGFLTYRQASGTGTVLLALLILGPVLLVLGPVLFVHLDSGGALKRGVNHKGSKIFKIIYEFNLSKGDVGLAGVVDRLVDVDGVVVRVVVVAAVVVGFAGVVAGPG